MTPSSFPRSGASTHPRAVQVPVARRCRPGPCLGRGRTGRAGSPNGDRRLWDGDVPPWQDLRPARDTVVVLATVEQPGRLGTALGCPCQPSCARSRTRIIGRNSTGRPTIPDRRFEDGPDGSQQRGSGRRSRTLRRERPSPRPPREAGLDRPRPTPRRQHPSITRTRTQREKPPDQLSNHIDVVFALDHYQIRGEVAPPLLAAASLGGQGFALPLPILPGAVTS